MARCVFKIEDQYRSNLRKESDKLSHTCITAPLQCSRCENYEKSGGKNGKIYYFKIVGGRSIWNIRYAEYTTLIANTKEELKDM